MAKNTYPKLYSKVFFILLLLGIFVLSFMIVKPFISAILSGAVLAYIAYPIYKKVLKLIKNENIAAFLVALVIILILSGPIITILGTLAKQAITTYNSIGEQGFGLDFLEGVCKDESSLVCRSTQSINSLIPGIKIQTYIQTIIEKIISYIGETLSNVLVAIPSIVLGIFIALFASYYFLKDGKLILKKITEIIPIENKHKSHIIKKFNQVTYAVFFGNIAIATIQGILGAIGFYIFGVSSPLLWAVIMIFTALIPTFGAAIIWFPAALNLVLMGYLDSNSSLVLRGIALFFYGAFLISTIDNILKPKIIGNRANVHPLLVLIGILGGINFFGISGIILGPAILSLLIVFVEIYQEKSKSA
tara:strand:- start:4974 stop:6056 length:1083 start_codon:yes stop_codon:yes gene_type:complete